VGVRAGSTPGCPTWVHFWQMGSTLLRVQFPHKYGLDSEVRFFAVNPFYKSTKGLVMKVRFSFVSNSSTSSFIIKTYVLSQRQIEQIVDHINVAGTMAYREDDYCDDWGDHERNAWKIETEDGTITGYTFMDNFDMRYFLSEIGIDHKDIEWSD
jgi:hypothetical protein